MCFQIDGQLIECVPPRLKNTPNKFFPEKSCAGIHCPWSQHTHPPFTLKLFKYQVAQSKSRGPKQASEYSMTF